MKLTIDLKKVKSLKDIVLQIAKQIPKEELLEYKEILGIENDLFEKIYKSKNRSRKELFELLYSIYPNTTKRENGESEYLKLGRNAAYKTWKEKTMGNIELEYMLISRLNDYVRCTDPKYLKKFQNWLKGVVIENIEDKVFSQSNIEVL